MKEINLGETIAVAGAILAFSIVHRLMRNKERRMTDRASNGAAHG